jgi:hypothetical protein
MINLEAWTFYYTTDDDGIWITDGETEINLGYDPSIQDAVNAIEAL